MKIQKGGVDSPTLFSGGKRPIPVRKRCASKKKTSSVVEELARRLHRGGGGGGGGEGRRGGEIGDMSRGGGGGLGGFFLFLGLWGAPLFFGPPFISQGENSQVYQGKKKRPSILPVTHRKNICKDYYTPERGEGGSGMDISQSCLGGGFLPLLSWA